MDGRRIAVRAPVGSFIGRRREVGRVRTLLSDARLLTITGPGGAGKTRLAEELAADLARSFEGGIAVAYLASSQSNGDVLAQTAAALGIHATSTEELGQQLSDHAAGRALLLVLDNCEHVAAAAAELAAGLIDSAERLRVLATSRRPLHVPGEQIFPLGGLGTDAAIELFLDRARRAVPDLELDEAGRAHVSRICARLESMPLAVELAAAQVRSVGLAELADRVERGASALASRSTLSPERQRTLGRAVAWSYDLMNEAQRVVWRRLSVFSGGWTLDAAEEVVAFPPIETAAVAELVGDLVDQSMVVFDPVADRYRLIEVLGEFARARLQESGEEATLIERHRRWIVGLVETCDARWSDGEQPDVLDALEADSANLRSALDRCRRDVADHDGLRLASGAFAYWVGRASLAEGARWCEPFLGRSGDDALEARAHWRTGYLATFCFDFGRAHAMLDRASQLLEETGDARERGLVRAVRAGLLLYEHPEQCAESRHLADELIADETAVATARSWGSLVSAIASLALGDFARCRETCLAAAVHMRAARDLWSLERILLFLAHAEWQLDEIAAAEIHLIESIRITRTMRDLGHLAWASDTLAWVTLDQGRDERAARLIGIAEAEWIRSGARLALPFQRHHDAAVERLARSLGAARSAAAIDAGRALDAHSASAFSFILDESVEAESAESPRDSVLSSRELEIAALVAEGLANRAIGERLFLSPRTVEKHVEHVMDKLGVDSRAAIAAWHAKDGASR